MSGEMAAENYVSSEKEITVPFSDDTSEEVSDDQLIIEEEKLKLTNPVEAQNRREKRRARAQERERERKQAEEDLKKLRESSAKTERELAELRGYVTAQAQRPGPQTSTDGKDEFQKRLDDIESERKDAYAAYAAELQSGKMTPERQAHWDSKGRALDERRSETIVERQIAKARVQDEQSRVANEGMQFWRQRYPEVYRDPKAAYWARAHAMQRIAEGEPDGPELVEKAMEAAKIKFKLGKPTSAPTATERARMTGIPSSGGGGGDGKASGGIVMTRELKKMAEAMYSDLPQEKAWQKWANDIGRPLRERKVL